MPCLEKATAEGQEARVMSILAPGTGGALDATDLGLKKNFSLMRAARQAPTYNDIFVDVRILSTSLLSFPLTRFYEQEYSNRHPAMSFIHAMPGLVDTPLANNMPFYIRALMPIAKLFTTSIEDCGEWMNSALTNPEMKKGKWYVDQNANLIPANKINSDEASRKTLVEHFKQEMSPFSS